MTPGAIIGGVGFIGNLQAGGYVSRVVDGTALYVPLADVNEAMLAHPDWTTANWETFFQDVGNPDQSLRNAIAPGSVGPANAAPIPA